jgi:hypothetical protein
VGVGARKLTLEIDVGSDPISGRLADDRGVRPFSGWLELAAALQAAVDDSPTSTRRDIEGETVDD